MPKPIVDSKKCTGCAKCEEVCPVDVFSIEDGKAVVKNPDACIGCKACEASCPEKAIVVEE